MTKDSRTRLLIALILLALAALPYVQTLQHAFVNFDDNLYVTENAHVKHVLTWNNVAWAFTNYDAANWHPITWLSHMIDWNLFHDWAGGHHLINLLLHALNTLLVWLVLMRLTGAMWRSALVAALFAVHPLHVESVAWVSERKDVLSTTFGLAAMWCYAGYAKRGGIGRYLGVLIWFALSLMTKSMLVTLPCILLLLDVWPLRRVDLLGIGGATDLPEYLREDSPKVGLARAIIEKLPLFAMSAVICLVTIAAQRYTKALTPSDAMPLEPRIANAALAYAQYLQNIFWPQNLAVFYPHPGLLQITQVLTQLLLLLAITIMAMVFSRERPWLLIGWLFFVGTLVPVIGLVQVGLQSMADRYTYVPALGIFIMVVWSIPAPTTSAMKALLAAAACALVGVLTYAAIVQTSYWRDSRTLFARALSVTERNFMAHQNYGHALETAGDIDGAMEHYRKAIDIRPHYASAHENLATSLLRKGQFGAAIDETRLALRYNDESAIAYNLLGTAMLATGNMTEAEQSFRKSLALDPENLEARGNHGLALLQLKRFTEAAEELAIVVQARPDRIGVRMNLAHALASSGKTDRAIAELDALIAQGPQFGPEELNLEQRAQLHQRAREMRDQLKQQQSK